MKKFTWMVLFALVAGLIVSGCNDSSADGVSMDTVASYIASGQTAYGAPDRVLIVDTRTSAEYIDGHIKDALNVPFDRVQENGEPLYTNNFDTVSTTASDALADSWLKHMLVNQLVNDFVSTYQDSEIIFYGDNAGKMAKIAKKIGYTDVDVMDGGYARWAKNNPDLTELYGPGVVSMDRAAGSFVFTGSINTANYDNVSTRPTHHGITYKGGALSYYSFLQADIPPFCFHELLMDLGVSPEGNMANGINYGDMSEWQGKFPDGDRINFAVTWDGAGRYYELSELFEEKPSDFHPNPALFELVGMEPRMGGTRDANLLWNPGCIYCMYACVCGITSNDKANEETWFSDGGIYDTFNLPNDDRNYYAGRYFPKADLSPGKGGAIRIRLTLVK